MKGKVVSGLAMLTALSVVGAMIKIPAIVGSVALDVFPALLAAVLFGAGAGAVVAAFGHLLSALIGGFPLGPMHFLIAVEMAVLVWMFGRFYKNNKVLASVLFIIGNSFVAPLPFMFLMNVGFYLGIVPSLLIGSIINTVIALAAIPRLSSLVIFGLANREEKSMRDIITIPFNGMNSLIIACDNSGAIGKKEQDLVHVPYETVAYFSFRVAVMECIAAGGEPISVVLHNFCGNEPWDELVQEYKKGCRELNLSDVRITGSTESNFSLMQSALGLIVLGKKSIARTIEIAYSEQLKFAVVGMPLVGDEVLVQNDQVATLSVFQEVSMFHDVMVWPVGSRGILYEINQMFPNEEFSKEMVITNLDILKSAGPATCFLAVYESGQEEIVMKTAGRFFNPLQIKK